MRQHNVVGMRTRKMAGQRWDTETLALLGTKLQFLISHAAIIPEQSACNRIHRRSNLHRFSKSIRMW
jgi:hypothetical protein